MTLRLYDSFAGAKRPFEPADPERVTMYVCGPTVYSYAHIGNARAAVAFDVLFRRLRAAYGAKSVVYARNITDVDDKIITASKETGAPINEITEKFARVYREDMAALGVLSPTLEPLATGHIPQMQALVSRLMDVGAAYAAEGHVLFEVGAFETYGALSKVSQDDMLAGARVEVAPYKRNAADFVLWKPAAEDEPGWDAPAAWGFGDDARRGRPGWHLECSAMISTVLGETIDIHGGGADLRFPHHENEIAQSCAAHNGAPLARYWLHNGFLRMGADKMSKSLGNIQLAHDLLKDWSGETLRWALLSAQYRQPLEWTDALLEQSKRSLDRLYRALADAGDDVADDTATEPPREVLAALDDDLNTPAAFTALFQLRDALAHAEGPAARAEAATRLKAGGRLLGFLEEDPETWLKGDVDAIDAAEVEDLIARRQAARAAKDFAEADRLRDAIAALGVVVEDSPDGPVWRMAD
ncbi:MAG: cysteine--tRNA ligase [Pseudomonadota bacterium]